MHNQSTGDDTAAAQNNSDQHQPTVQYAVPNKKAKKNKDDKVHRYLCSSNLCIYIQPKMS